MIAVKTKYNDYMIYSSGTEALRNKSERT